VAQHSLTPQEYPVTESKPASSSNSNSNADPQSHPTSTSAYAPHDFTSVLDASSLSIPVVLLRVWNGCVFAGARDSGKGDPGQNSHDWWWYTGQSERDHDDDDDDDEDDDDHNQQQQEQEQEQEQEQKQEHAEQATCDDSHRLRHRHDAVAADSAWCVISNCSPSSVWLLGRTALEQTEALLEAIDMT